MHGNNFQRSLSNFSRLYLLLGKLINKKYFLDKKINFIFIINYLFIYLFEKNFLEIIKKNSKIFIDCIKINYQSYDYYIFYKANDGRSNKVNDNIKIRVSAEEKVR